MRHKLTDNGIANSLAHYFHLKIFVLKRFGREILTSKFNVILAQSDQRLPISIMSSRDCQNV